MPTDEADSPKVNTQLEALIRTLLTDRPIAYHATVAKAVGSATAGVLLSQFLYWTPRTDDPDGWFYKTQAEITDETALTRWEQETARARLKSLGVLEEKRRGVPGKIYFRVSFPQLQTVLLSHNVGNPHSTMRKNHIVESEAPGRHNVGIPQSGKPAKHNAENHHSISENTSEITESDSDSRPATRSEVLREGGQLPAAEPPVPTGQSAAVSGQPRPSATDDDGVDAAIAEVCKTLTGGTVELTSHRTQARTLWQQSGLSAGAFQVLLAEVCATVTNQRRVRKPMAYFFRCLRERLSQPELTSEVIDAAPVEEVDEPAFAALPANVDGQKLWTRAAKRLAERVTRPIYETYLAPAQQAENADGRLLVQVASDFAAEWLDTKLRPLVMQAVAEEFGLSVAVEFVSTEGPATAALG